MKTTTLTLSAIIGAILAPFTGIAILLILTAIAIIFDWLTGFTVAAINGELQSSVGIKGVFKKLLYVFGIAAAMILDILIAQGLPQIGMEYTFAGGALVTAILCVWLVLNELISILENLSRAGVPMPSFLETIIHEIKNKVDKNE